MASSRSYVIVTGGSGQARLQRVGRRPHRGGRHRLGTPGTTARYPGTRSRRPTLRRARHRRTERPSVFAVRYASILVLLGAVGTSGWFAAGGATAFAQMIQP